MKYKLIDGKMVRVSDFESDRIFEDKKVSYVWTMPEVKSKVASSPAPFAESSIVRKGKNGVYARSSLLALAPIVGGVTIGASQGVFWDAFLQYIFPWMLDISKVFCAIKIAQAFYQEKRADKNEGGGLGALVQYGKWYLVFWLIPWGVELIDQVGAQMFNDLQKK